MAPSSSSSRVADVPCLGCGCLCDDIIVEVNSGRIVTAEQACPLGMAWFLADPDRDGWPSARIEGVACEAAEALDRAAAILSEAQSPLVLGLVGGSLEAQAAAVAIADRIGAAIDPSSSADSLPRWRAIQRIGFVSATLGEVRDRADVVVFWDVDPVTSHPRHLERYSGDAVGRFVPDGRVGRTLVVIAAAPSPTTATADRVFLVTPQDRGDLLASLRAVVRGDHRGQIDERVRSLGNLLLSARYGAWFFGPESGRGPEESAVVEEMFKLVRDLNAKTRFVALTLGGPGNAAGSENVLTWQSGAPLAVDFSKGHPRFLPDEATAERLLTSGEADAALIVADDPRRFLSRVALDALGRIPTVAIASEEFPASVAMLSARPGIEGGGTVIRSDGATLPLRPPLPSRFPTDRQWLEALDSRLGALRP